MAADYRTTITSAPVPGLRAEVVEGGSRISLTWSGAGTLVVLDPDGTPFLRLTPAGVETNEGSPYAYTTRDRRGLTVVPAGLSGEDWKRTSSSPKVIYHEHRAHWTSTTKPAGSGEFRVRDWTVPLTVDGSAAVLGGTLDYVPGPSPLPYVALALVVALAAAAAVRAGRLGAVPCLVVVIADAVRAVGTGLTAADQPAKAMVSAIGLSGLGWVLLVVAAVGLLRGRTGAVVLAAVGGALVALSGGLPASGALTASLPLTEWPYAVQRTAIAISLGAGLGLLLGLVAAFQRLSAQQAAATPG